MPNSVFDLLGELSVDTTQLETIQEQVQRALAGVSSQQGTAKIAAKDDQFRATVRLVRQEADKLDRTVIRPTVQLDTARAKSDFAELRSWFDGEMAEIDAMHAKTEGMIAARNAHIPAGRSFSRMVGGATAAVAGAAGVGLFVQQTTSAAYDSQKMGAATTRLFGDAGGEFVAMAKRMQEETGFLAEDVMGASLSLRTLKTDLGLTNDQLTKLIATSGDLAAVTPGMESVSQASDVLKAALRGQTQGAEELGISLSDNYMKTVALNGRLKDTWDQLSAAEQAQLRYQEIIRQTAVVQGAASDGTDQYGESLRQSKAALQEAAVSLGTKLLPIATKFLEILDSIPTPMLEAGMAASALAGVAMTLGGSLAMLKGGIGGLGGAATTAGPVVQTLTTSVGSLGTASIGTAGPLAAVAVAVGALSLYLLDIAEDTEKATKQQEEAGARQTALMQMVTAKRTGMGDASDPMQAEYVATRWKMVDGALYSYNQFGRSLSSEAQQWQREQRAGDRAWAISPGHVQVSVALEDRTSGGVKTTQLDARSHELQN